jgi:hypothetical protein
VQAATEDLAACARRSAPTVAATMIPKYLSPLEFSELSGLSIATVRRYVDSGKLPSWQPAGFRGRVLIPSDALAPSAASSELESLPDPPSATRVGRPSDVPSRTSGPVAAWRRGRSL